MQGTIKNSNHLGSVYVDCYGRVYCSPAGSQELRRAEGAAALRARFPEGVIPQDCPEPNRAFWRLAWQRYVQGQVDPALLVHTAAGLGGISFDLFHEHSGLPECRIKYLWEEALTALRAELVEDPEQPGLYLTHARLAARDHTWWKRVVRSP